MFLYLCMYEFFHMLHMPLYFVLLSVLRNRRYEVFVTGAAATVNHIHHTDSADSTYTYITAVMWCK